MDGCNSSILIEKTWEELKFFLVSFNFEIACQQFSKTHQRHSQLFYLHKCPSHLRNSPPPIISDSVFSWPSFIFMCHNPEYWKPQSLLSFIQNVSLFPNQIPSQISQSSTELNSRLALQPLSHERVSLMRGLQLKAEWSGLFWWVLILVIPRSWWNICSQDITLHTQLITKSMYFREVFYWLTEDWSLQYKVNQKV